MYVVRTVVGGFWVLTAVEEVIKSKYLLGCHPLLHNKLVTGEEMTQRGCGVTQRWGNFASWSLDTWNIKKKVEICAQLSCSLFFSESHYSQRKKRRPRAKSSCCLQLCSARRRGLQVKQLVKSLRISSFQYCQNSCSWTLVLKYKQHTPNHKRKNHAIIHIEHITSCNTETIESKSNALMNCSALRSTQLPTLPGEQQGEEVAGPGGMIAGTEISGLQLPLDLSWPRWPMAWILKASD